MALTPENQQILYSLIEMEKGGALDRTSFTDLPIEVYHHRLCPGISSTTLKTVLKKSWAHHLVGEQFESDPFRFGNAFHCFSNEPKRFRDAYYVAPFKRRVGQDWEEAKATAGDRTIIMCDDFELIRIMTKKLYEHPIARQLIVGSQCEVTFFVRDKETGVLKKCRVDNIKGDELSDLKSTIDGSLDEFTFQAKKLLYRISGTYYLEIVSEFYNELFDKFNLIACEKEVPNEIAIYPLSERSRERASEEIRSALRTIATIQKNPNAWKGYALEKTPIDI